ncbi:MAG TPA: thioredoxin domain-containing protein [Candidatus Binatia bacterium]|nr:thioredoxin domain-containing protein [Candidatus Binatia bacterium]
MNRFAHAFVTIGLLLAGSYSFAQAARPAKPDASAKPGPASSSGNASLPSEATVDGFLKAMFGWNTELSWKVAEIKPSEAPGISQATVVFNTPKGSQVVRIYVTPDQKYAFMAELVPFGADPFAPTRGELKAANGPSEGPQDATITIVEFGDLECPACKAAQPNIAKLMQEEPKVRLVFQNYPLEQIHKWALTAARYLDCLARQNNAVAWKFIATVYDHQSEVNEQNVEQMLKGYVRDSGGDPDAVAACTTKAETAKRVQDSIALAEKLDVTSTPTFFINGRRLVGFSNNTTPYDAVKAMVDYEVANSR